MFASIAFLFLLTLGSQVFANGPNDIPPSCSNFYGYEGDDGEFTCGVFTQSIVIDLSSYLNQVIPLQSKGGTYMSCSKVYYVVAPEGKLYGPTIDSWVGGSNTVILKDYVEKSGGIDNLYRYEQADCFSEETTTVAVPKDGEGYSSNIIELLLPKNDLKDFDLEDAYWVSTTTIGGLFTEIPTISAYHQASLPNVIKHKDYYYRPAGFYCDTPSMCNKLVLYRYKEIWTLDNEMKEEHQLFKPSLKGLRLALLTSSTEASLKSSPTTSSAPTPTTSTNSQKALPTPLTVKPTPSIPWWARFGCWLIELFGGKC